MLEKKALGDMPYWITYVESFPWISPRVGVTKPISWVPLFSKSFSIVKISGLYLTGVTTAQLGGHLLNMNMIQQI